MANEMLSFKNKLQTGKQFQTFILYFFGTLCTRISVILAHMFIALKETCVRRKHFHDKTLNGIKIKYTETAFFPIKMQAIHILK